MTPIRQPLQGRPRREIRALGPLLLRGLGVLSLFPVVCAVPAHAEGFGPAHGGDDGWLPSLAQDLGAGAWTLGAGAAYQPGLVPPFRAGSRDRLAFGVGGRWVPDRRVQLSAGFDGLYDRSAGGSELGAGDVRLGATTFLADLGPVRPWLGFAVKLPDAKDEGELGTDETDITFGGAAEVHLGAWRALAGVGLGVLGNPLRFANQDDVPEVRAAVAWTPAGWIGAGACVNGDLATARNPARVVAGGWVRAAVPLSRGSRFAGFAELGGGAGLTPAAPDGVVALSIGMAARSAETIPLPAAGLGD